MAFHVSEECRIKTGPMGSNSSYGNNGAFGMQIAGIRYFAIASDHLGWEHISISLDNRCPTWDEMCLMKSLFWDDEDCVVEYHPPKSSYVNNDPFTLHMWKCADTLFPQPPSFMVGLKKGQKYSDVLKEFEKASSKK